MLDTRWEAYNAIARGNHRWKEDMLSELLKEGIWRNFEHTRNYQQVIRLLEARVKGAKAVRYEAIKRSFHILAEPLIANV